MHEKPDSHTEIKIGSERGFGLVFAAAFAVIAVWPLLDGGAVRFWAAGVAVAFAGVALLRPGALRPLNLLWFKFGLLLGKIATPVVMALVFVIAVVPVAVIMRLAGKDLLHLKRDGKAASYWIARDEPGPLSGSMKNQF